MVSEQQSEIKFCELEQVPVSSANKVRTKRPLFVKMEFLSTLITSTTTNIIKIFSEQKSFLADDDRVN